MQKGDFLNILIKCPQTVLSTQDIMLLWGESNISAAQVRINYYCKKDHLIRLRKGIYVKDKNYSRLELASKILSPSYVSFETILVRAGVIFQYYSQIFIASYTTREIIIDSQIYNYQRIKENILTNNLGMKYENTYFFASPERAFLDTIYLNKDYHFDNVTALNFKEVYKILPIYGGNKRIESTVKKYFDNLEKDKKT